MNSPLGLPGEKEALLTPWFYLRQTPTLQNCQFKNVQCSWKTCVPQLLSKHATTRESERHNEDSMQPNKYYSKMMIDINKCVVFQTTSLWEFAVAATGNYMKPWPLLLDLGHIREKAHQLPEHKRTLTVT